MIKCQLRRRDICIGWGGWGRTPFVRDPRRGSVNRSCVQSDQIDPWGNCNCAFFARYHTPLTH